MKKRITLFLTAILAVASLTACGGNTSDSGKITIGLGVSTDFNNGSKSIGEKENGQTLTATNAQADIYVATVMLDTEGTILKCVVDSVAVAATVNEKGEMVTDPNTTFQTKKELGSEYGMAGYSASEGVVYGDGVGGIGKEWDAQVNAFAMWCENKTIDEVKSGIGTDGYPTDKILLSGCTINTSKIVAAVVDACENATTTSDTLSANDALGLGITAELSNYTAPSTNAETGESTGGSVGANVNYAATTQNADGKITCVLIDSIQATSTWDSNGILTTDTTSEILTKYEQQYDYGMAGYSASEGAVYGDGVGGIGKEWFEQINNFKLFITDMTADEVKNIVVNDGGYPTDKVLITGCTIDITDFKTAVVKSLEK